MLHHWRVGRLSGFQIQGVEVGVWRDGVEKGRESLRWQIRVVRVVDGGGIAGGVKESGEQKRMRKRRQRKSTKGER